MASIPLVPLQYGHAAYGFVNLIQTSIIKRPHLMQFSTKSVYMSRSRVSSTVVMGKMHHMNFCNSSMHSKANMQMDAREDLECFQRLATKAGAQLAIAPPTALAAEQHGSTSVPPPPRRIHPAYHRMLHDDHLLHYGVSDCSLPLSAVHDFILMTCLTFPHHDCLPDRLSSICRYLMWIFLFDEFFDNPKLLGADPDAAALMAETVFRSLKQTLIPNGGSGVELSVNRNICIDMLVQNAASWWAEFHRLGMTPGQQNRFLHTFHCYIGGIIQQTRHCNSGTLPPDLPSFKTMRSHTIGITNCCVLLEFSLGFDILSDLPPDGCLRRSLEALSFNAALEGGVFNDLLSFVKEAEMGHYMNLVAYLYVRNKRRRRYGVEREEELEEVVLLEEAVEEARAMVRECEVEARRLEAVIEAEMLVEEMPVAAQMSSYVRGIAEMTAGLKQWQREAWRYTMS